MNALPHLLEDIHLNCCLLDGIKRENFRLTNLQVFLGAQKRRLTLGKQNI